MKRPRSRPGFSLIELLVVIAILAILAAILMAAVQRARSAADKVYCVNNLKQIGVGLHSYQAIYGSFPPGTNPYPAPASTNPYYATYGGLSWFGFILPYVEQGPAWKQVGPSYAADSYPNHNPPHIIQSMIMPLYTCPGDKRVLQVQYPGGVSVALTSYQGVNGTNLRSHDGMLFGQSLIRLADVPDGLSNTLMVGERPPSADMYFGWWYSGAGQWDYSQPNNVNTGCGDVTLGTQEINIKSVGLPEMNACPNGPYSYGPGSLTNNCDMFHFWSLHINGANFTFADGSVRFINYSAANVLPMLGTRAGNDPVVTPY